MLISFSVENWMSFRDKVTFSMVASRERQHKERISAINKYQTKILPIAAIYGGNASGKTNFFQALNFVKSLVVKGSSLDSLIPIEVFKLDPQNATQPARFILELLINETIYEFSFAVTRKAIVEEKLVLISSKSEKILYNRHNNKPNFDKSLAKDKFLQFAFRGTRDNQLFLHNAVSQKVDKFRPIYDWFENTLELVGPDSRFEPFEQFFEETHPYSTTMNEMLTQLDTGITRLGLEEIPLDNLLLPEALKKKLEEDIKHGSAGRLIPISSNGRIRDIIFISRPKEELITKKLVTFHPMANGEEIRFEIHQESDGSQRLIDLLPAFLELYEKTSQKVYVIDEIDRSLHTLLTRNLLEVYLANCSAETRKQLLFTTHDVLLMDQQLLRRDEMWIAERNATGVSNLLSFSEYKDVRADKDLQKSYLQGRLGGIPRILFNKTYLPK
ncbi:MAG: ATP/GTP-binding protein [Gammaproteobacteria bacterium]